jgi:hypothetical protein
MPPYHMPPTRIIGFDPRGGHSVIGPFMKQLDELFKPYFGGKSAAAELENVKT